MTNPETALLDRSVLEHMVTVEPIVHEETIPWGNHPVSVPISGMRRKPIQLRDQWLLVSSCNSPDDGAAGARGKAETVYLR